VTGQPDPLDGVEGTARAPDGLILRTLRWQPAGEPWAAMLLVHGLGEHVGRYRHVGRSLAEAGLDVHAYDHRGFGGSAGARAYVDRWSRFHDDLEARLAALRAMHPTLPLVLYAHSMGGLIALGYVFADPPRRPMPDLLVLSAPGLEIRTAWWKVRFAPVVAALLPRLRFSNGIGRGALSRDPRVDEANAVDPLMQTRSTARLGDLAFREQRRVRQALRQPGPLPMPTYVFHGADDRVVPVGTSEPFEGRANVTRRIYPGLRHEPHNEPEGPQVIADVIDWIRVAAPRRATDVESRPTEHMPPGSARRAESVAQPQTRGT